MVFVLQKALSLYADTKDSRVQYVVILCVLVVLLSPSFITAFLRLFVPERMEFVFLALFVASFVYMLAHQNSNNAKTYIAFGVGLMCANMALYYKETAFAMIGAFGFFHLVFGFRGLSKKIKVFDIALMISSAVWILVYYVVVIATKTTSSSYGDTPYNQLIVFAKVVFGYCLNEPFLFIGLPLLCVIRIYDVVCKKGRIYPLYDSCLITALVLMAEYLVLRLGDVHYVLPAYIFGIVALAGAWCMYKNKIIKCIYGICAVIFLCNALPYSIYQFVFYKCVPNNFQDTLAFVSAYTKQNPHTRIYLEGVNRASGVEVYASFGKWLGFYGGKDFDLFSDIGIDNVLLGKEHKDSEYSVFQSNAIIPKQKGDIVILTPYTGLYVDNALLASLESKYKLLHTSDFGFNIPKLGIKSFLKYKALRTNMRNSDALLSDNAFGLPLYFYVYQVE